VLRPSAQRSIVPAARRLARRPGAEGALFAIIPPPRADELAAIARLRTLYRWCGVVIIDVASFDSVAPRTRAEMDQRIAAAEGALIRAGWRVRSAGARDRFRDVWQTITNAGPYLQSSASRRS